MWWQHWWVWMVAGGVLAILELLVPAFVFLGFACGAVVTGLLVAVGLVGASGAPLIFVFALASLGAWFALRRVFGKHEGQVKVWERDINDN